MELSERLLNAINSNKVAVFYTSWDWTKKRKIILKRDNNECQLCKTKGRYSKGRIVHHIKHLKDRPDLAMSDDNLLTVCDTCHNLVHPEKLEYYYKKTKRIISEEKW